MNVEHRTSPPIAAPAEAGLLAEARFVPQRYEPNYAYPLLVMFHGRGGDEHQMVRSMPAMSWRNYVGLGLRGPEVAIRHEHHDGYGWGPAFARPDRRNPSHRARPARSRDRPPRALPATARPTPIDLWRTASSRPSPTSAAASTSIRSGSSSSAAARARRWRIGWP